MKVLTDAELIICLGIFLFGYDTGIGGGVLVLPTFAADFGITGSKQHVADLQGNVVAILQGGAFFGAIIMYATNPAT